MWKHLCKRHCVEQPEQLHLEAEWSWAEQVGVQRQYRRLRGDVQSQENREAAIVNGVCVVPVAKADSAA